MLPHNPGTPWRPPLSGSFNRDAMPATNEQERTRKLGAHMVEGYGYDNAGI